MSFSYRRVDLLLAGGPEVGLEPGDYVLVEEGGVPGEGELVIIRVNGAERICRWDREVEGEVVGVVVGIRRRL